MHETSPRTSPRRGRPRVAAVAGAGNATGHGEAPADRIVQHAGHTGGRPDGAARCDPRRPDHPAPRADRCPPGRPPAEPPPAPPGTSPRRTGLPAPTGAEKGERGDL